MDKIKYMHEILDIVMRVNGGAAERNGNGHPTAFYEYSGHVNVLTLNILPNGWTRDRDYNNNADVKKFWISMDYDDDSYYLDMIAKLRAYAFSLKFKNTILPKSAKREDE